MKLFAKATSNLDPERLGGQDLVELLQGNAVFLKAYGSPDGTKIRIALPELKNFAQVKIDPDKHYIEFERDATSAQRSVKR